MLKSFGSSYCILGIGLVVFTKGYTDRSLDLIRGKFRDQFVNPLCTNSSCMTASCERYNAVCSYSGCEYCVCNKDNQSTTYFPSNGSADGQCMQDSVIARNSGCFNPSHGGYSFYTLDTLNCAKNCTEKEKIGSFNLSSTTTCTLWWAGSSFSINNQYWKPTEDFVNDFSLSFNNTTSPQKQLYIKVNLQACKRWVGALLKLQIQCHTQNTQPHYSEHFSVIFKFTGYHRAYQATPTSDEILVTPNSTTNSTMGPTPGHKTMPKPGDQYLASTIALSGILFLVFVFLGFGIFLLLRSHKRHDSEEPTMETDIGTTHPEAQELQLRV